MASIGPNNPTALPPRPPLRPPHTLLLSQRFFALTFCLEVDRLKAEALKVSHVSQLCVLMVERNQNKQHFKEFKYS